MIRLENDVCGGARDSDTLDEARAWGAGREVSRFRVCSGRFLVVTKKFGNFRQDPFKEFSGDIF